MEYIKVVELPELRRGIIVAAFGGWGDAGEIATTATRLLIKQFRAKKFASLDPEEFYDFTKTRPTTRILSSTERTLEWPANDFYYWRDQAGDHDYLALVGVDPHLRWKHFVGEIVELARATGVEMILTLGGYLGEVPHSRIGTFTGRANRPDLEARLADLGVMPSSYQGPTGIHSVLMDATERAGLPNASLWGVVPHYIPMIANPKVCAALLRKVSDFLAIEVDLREMDLAGRQFERQVNEAIRQNPEVAAYVKQLEANLPPEEAVESLQAGGEAELPSGEAVVRDLEEFLRRRQQEGDPGGTAE